MTAADFRGTGEGPASSRGAEATGPPHAPTSVISATPPAAAAPRDLHVLRSPTSAISLARSHPATR
ncbi:hypothetical protein GCM10018987_39080 [Streptomyces cremeus]